jgi:hypothetical protein
MGRLRGAFLPQYVSVCVTRDWSRSCGHGCLGFWSGAAETVEGEGTWGRDATGVWCWWSWEWVGNGECRQERLSWVFTRLCVRSYVYGCGCAIGYMAAFFLPYGWWLYQDCTFHED